MKIETLLRFDRRHWRRKGGAELADDLRAVTSSAVPVFPVRHRPPLSATFGDRAVGRVKIGSPPRVLTLWAGLERVLQPAAPLAALRAWLWLGIAWDFLPTTAELGGVRDAR